MLITPSLSTFVDWTQILPVLGINPTTSILPYKIPCRIPNCTGQMTLYPDKYYVLWAHCPVCNFCGDIIELSAAHWEGLTIDQTVNKLILAGVAIPPERVVLRSMHNYKKKHTDRRKELNDYWRKAQLSYLTDNNKVLNDLQYRLSIRPSKDRKEWLERQGAFIGASTKIEIDAVFRGLTWRYGYDNEATGSEVIFTGSGWNDVLVLPGHDLPGRFKSFLFYGRNLDPVEDLRAFVIRYDGLYVQDRFTRRLKTNDINGGLFLYESLKYANDDVIVMSNPLLATQMQLWHLRLNPTPAPVISINDMFGCATHPMVWNHIAQTPIFWGAPSPALFMHARETNARICLDGFDAKGAIQGITKTGLEEWTNIVRRKARPWDEVLEEQLVTLPVDVADAILSGMGLEIGEFNEFYNKAPDAVKERVYVCLNRIKSKTVRVNKDYIREENDKWVLDKTNNLICDAVLRIDRVVYHPKREQTYYDGRVLYKGREMPFYELSKIVENNTFLWMRYLILRNTNAFLEYDAHYEPTAVDIATRFHKPEVVRGYNSIGWDKERNCFVFPDFLIMNNGRIFHDRGIKVNKRILPALMLKEPEDLTAVEIAKLQPSVAASVFWAITACVISNIIAPSKNYDVAAIALTDNLVAAGKKILLSLGCTEFVVQNDFATLRENTLDDVVDLHNWPILLRTPKSNYNLWLEWLENTQQRNVIVSLDWYAAKVFGMSKGWHIVIEPPGIDYPLEWPAAGKIIPSVLKYYAKNQFILPSAGNKLADNACIHRTIQLLNDWFTAQGGTFDIKRITAMLYPDGTEKTIERTADNFMDIVCRLFVEGDLPLERKGLVSDSKLNKDETMLLIPGDENKIFIPRMVINRVLAKRKAPNLPHALVSNAVKLIGGAAAKYGDILGWLVPEVAFNTRLAAYTKMYKDVSKLNKE